MVNDLTNAEEALIEHQIVEDIFKDSGLVPESIEKQVDEKGNIIAWIPHFEPRDLNFTLTDKGRKLAEEKW